MLREVTLRKELLSREEGSRLRIELPCRRIKTEVEKGRRRRTRISLYRGLGKQDNANSDEFASQRGGSPEEYSVCQRVGKFQGTGQQLGHPVDPPKSLDTL